MPITQERFILVLRGAKAILDKQRSLKQACEDSDQLISEANAALDYIEDERTKRSISMLIGAANTLAAIVKSGDNIYFDLSITVMAELKHFDKAKIANARAAKLQRQARVEKGIKPRQDYLLGEQLAPSMTPTLQPLFLDGAIQDKPKVIPFEQTSQFKNFEEQMKKMRAKKSASAKQEEKVDG